MSCEHPNWNTICLKCLRVITVRCGCDYSHNVNWCDCRDPHPYTEWKGQSAETSMKEGR